MTLRNLYEPIKIIFCSTNISSLLYFHDRYWITEKKKNSFSLFNIIVKLSFYIIIVELSLEFNKYNKKKSQKPSQVCLLTSNISSVTKEDTTIAYGVAKNFNLNIWYILYIYKSHGFIVNGPWPKIRSFRKNIIINKKFMVQP